MPPEANLQRLELLTLTLEEAVRTEDWGGVNDLFAQREQELDRLARSGANLTVAEGDRIFDIESRILGRLRAARHEAGHAIGRQNQDAKRIAAYLQAS